MVSQSQVLQCRLPLVSSCLDSAPPSRVGGEQRAGLGGREMESISQLFKLLCCEEGEPTGAIQRGHLCSPV